MVATDDRYRPWKVSTIEAVGQIIGATAEGLTGSQIERVLARCKLPDPGPITKARRITDSLVQAQTAERTCKPVLRLLLAAMEPQSYVDQLRVFTERQARLNAVLVFEGVRINDGGKVAAGPKAATLSAAAQHANSLRAELVRRVASYEEVFLSCTAELLERNTFHALLEATKGFADRVRSLTASRSTARISPPKRSSAITPASGSTRSRMSKPGGPSSGPQPINALSQHDPADAASCAARPVVVTTQRARRVAGPLPALRPAGARCVTTGG